MSLGDGKSLGTYSPEVKWLNILKSVSRKEDDSPSTMPNGRQEGKQSEREREEEGWKREHMRLLLVICVAFKSSENYGTPDFSSLIIEYLNSPFYSNSLIPKLYLRITPSFLQFFQNITSIVVPCLTSQSLKGCNHSQKCHTVWKHYM